MIYIIIGLVLVLAGVSFATVNLLLKSEKQEDIILKQQEYLSSVYQAIVLSKTKLEEIDAKGSFKADDEIGWFFKNVSYIQDILNEYIKENGLKTK